MATTSTATVSGTTTTQLVTGAGCNCAMCQASRAAASSTTTTTAGASAAAAAATTLSGVNAIDSLLAGDTYRWNYTGTAKGGLGTSVTVTYSFMSSLPSDYSSSSISGFTPLTSAQQAAVVEALDYISSVINVTFVYKADGTGQIRYGQNNQGSASAAYAYYPGSGVGGDVWLNTAASTNSDMTLGGYGYMTLIHETGHALGLKHPGNYNATGGGTAGPYLPSATDTTQYSVMSYNAPNQTTANYAKYSNYNYFAQTYQLYDIQALQYLYGANTTSNSGDTTYTFATTLDVETIYDGNGDNTISAANQTYGATINLNAGSFSSIGYNTAVNALMKNNIAIAYGTVINNAIGGAGADTLIGNSNNDTFKGLGGNDTIKGTAGTASTAIFQGNYADYTVVTVSGTTTVTDNTASRDGTDSLTYIKYLQFADQTVTVASVPTVTAKPVVKGVPTTLKVGATVALTSLYTVTAQAADTVSQIKVVDPTGGGALDLSALTLGTDYTKSDTTYTIVASKAASVNYIAGGGESLSISAQGALGWSSAVAAVITNKAPVVTAKAATGKIGASLSLSDLFSVTDAESDTITQYKVVDPTGGGTIVLNSATNLSSVSGTTIVSAADLSKVTYTIGATEALKISAYDGGTWSAAASVTITNKAPVVAAKAATGKIGASLSLSALFSVTDTESDTITQYKVVDPTGGGAIVLNSATNLSSVSGTTIVSAADLSKVTYTIGATEALKISAYDGGNWSAATSVTITNKAPVVTAKATSAKNGNSLSLSALFTVTDTESDTITQYKVVDPTGGGTIVLNGATNLSSVSGTTIVSAADLSKVTYTVSGSESLKISAYDGGTWSAAASVAITNTAALVTTSAVTAKIGTTIALSSKVSTSDGQGDTITQYKVVTPSSAGTIGLNGASNLSSASNTTAVSTSDFSKLTYTVSRTANLTVAAYDGATWSSAKALTVTNKAATVTATAKSIATGASVAVSSLITASDAESDTITQYRFGKVSGLGTLNLGGATNLASTSEKSSGIVIVSASDLSKLTFTAGSSAGVGSFTAQANDGGGFGSAVTAKVTGVSSGSLTAKTLASALSSLTGSSLATTTSSAIANLLTKKTTSAILASV